MIWLTNTMDLFLEAAPWLVMGLVLAGLIKAWMPEGALSRWLGGKGLWPVIKGALIGAPLPLCSCGVLPAAVGLHREGASKGATAAFLVATPETGPDSVAVSYALLGPLMAIYRPVAAITSAIASGILTSLVPNSERVSGTAQADTCCNKGKPSEKQGLANRTVNGLKFAFTDMLADIGNWLIIGFLVAGAAMTIMPPQSLAEYGSGLTAMLVMAAAGVPLYVCASASTPIAAALITAGVSPGTALVFLLVGPATNFAALMVLSKELGKSATAAYLTGLIVTAIASGLGLDALISAFDIDMAVQISSAHGMLPRWFEGIAAALLAAALIRPLFNSGKSFVARLT